MISGWSRYSGAADDVVCGPETQLCCGQGDEIFVFEVGREPKGSRRQQLVASTRAIACGGRYSSS